MNQCYNSIKTTLTGSCLPMTTVSYTV